MAIVALTNPTYQPAMRVITAITNAYPAVITTSFDHDYSTGLYVRFIIAPGGGMVQLNNKAAYITVLNATQFSIPIDTTPFDVFVVPLDVDRSTLSIPMSSPQK